MRTRTILAAALVATMALGSAASAQEASSPSVEKALRARVESSEGKEKGAAAAELATLLERESRWSEAASAWRQARKARGDLSDLEGEAGALLAFAEDVVGQGETGGAVAAAFEDARTALKRARAAGSKSLDTALGLARCAEMAGETVTQLDELRAARAAAPADVRARRALAAALASSGAHTEALALYRELSTNEPKDVDLALAAGAVAHAAGDEPAEIEAVRRAINAAPRDARGWIALWKVFSPKQRWGEYADAVLSVAKDQSDSAVAAHYAGMACATARRFDEALVWLEKAWTLQPNDWPTKTEAARIYFAEKNDRARSIQLYSEVIAGDPSNKQAGDGLFWVAKRFTDEGKPRDSVPLFEILAKSRPNDSVAQGNLANSYRFAGRYADSERAYLVTIATSPNDAQLRNDYALLLDVMGRNDDAVKVLTEAHGVDPLNNDSMENLGFLARAKGDRDEALRWFRMAHGALVAKGANDHKHRINVDDQRWPLPALQ